MTELAVRSLQGRADPREERELSAWRRSSPANERAYQEIVHLWGAAEAVRPPAVGGPPAPEDVVRLADLRRRPDEATPGPRRRAWPMRIAAAAMAVLGFGLAELHFATRPAALGAAEFATGMEETVTVKLGDGSTIRLAPRSRLRLTGERDEREVWLEGRAFFGVAEQDGRPFVIHTRLGQARVLGTRFDLGVKEDDLRLIVVEGRVALAAGGEEVEVSRGEMSVALDGASPSVVEVEDVHALLGWMDHALIFQSTPLQQAAAEIGRVFGVRVEVRDPVLARRTVSASFSDEPLEDVITAICRVVGARCTVNDATGTVIIDGRGPM